MRDFNATDREYSRAFYVQTSQKTDDPNIVKTAVGLPFKWQTYNTETYTDLEAVCYERTFTQNAENPLIWDVRCSYSTVAVDWKAAVQTQDDPILEPPEIEFSFEQRPKALYGYPDPQQAYIGGGKPAASSGVVNSAGEPFDPPAEIDVSYPVLTISRNEPLFLPAIAVRFQDAVNSDVFWGVNKHCAKIKGIRGVRQYKRNKGYWRVTYQIAFNRETWDLQLLDHGTYYIDASDGDKKKKFKTDAPEELPRLGNLTSDGDDGGSTIRFKVFDKVWREEQFSLLNLPTVQQVNQ